MRPFVFVLAIIFLAALVAGQEVTRRERLRGLISAARGGDVEARKALRSLRDKLRKRTGQVEHVATQPEPEVQPEQQTVDVSEPLVESPVEEILPESEPVQTHSRSRQPQQPQRERARVLLDPHRALNRGLEVDTRSEANAVIKVTNQTRTPPIQTIRRYSYFDEQGNYIFGYEGADGSFKEEKRGLNCIVHGKYGYVDPDGVRREYTYVSGNECDPNAPAQEEPQTDRVLNNQFLEETISGEPSPQRFREPSPTPIRSQVNRRRRPVKVQHQTQQEFINIPKEIPEQISVVQPEQEKILPEVNIPQVEQIQPKPLQEIPVVVTTQRTTIPHFQIKTEAVVPLFRPTPKPINFDFDTEFKNIFSHFGIQRPRAQILPAPTRAPIRHPLPPPPPPPKVIQQPIIAKPAPAPAPAPVPVQSEPKPANVPHQLVFDSTTGTFKTVPFSPINLAVIQVPIPKASDSKTPLDSTKAGKPLPLAGFNPLPAVPLGSLSFKGATVASAAQFDNFFNQFRINQ